jgi:dynein heavy chain
MSRFNKLLKAMRASLIELDKAIKGLITMSAELDSMYTSFTKLQVPENWARVSYLSLKPLSSWVADLNDRVEFIREWLVNGNPISYWLSAFFFP